MHTTGCIACAWRKTMIIQLILWTIQGFSSVLAVSEFFEPTEISLRQETLEIGDLCTESTLIATPTIGNRTLVRGRQEKLFSFTDCAYTTDQYLLAQTFSVKGSGEAFLASSYSDFASVHVNTGCGDDNGCAEETKSLTEGTRWQTVDGETYYIIVSVRNSHYQNNAEDFVLSVGVWPVLQLGSSGEDPLSPIDLGVLNAANGTVLIEGSTSDGGYLSNLPTCDFDVDSFSLVYVVTVEDSNVFIAAEATGRDARLSVFQEEDDGFTCLSMPRRPSKNSLSWHNEKAKSKYYISINGCCGFRASSTFWLKLNATRYRDICEDAVPIDIQAGYLEHVDFGTKGLYRNIFVCNSYYEGLRLEDFTITSPIALYQFVGTGDTVFIELPDSSGYPNLNLFSANACNDTLVCVETGTYGTYLAFDTVEDDLYLLVLYWQDGENTPLTLKVGTTQYGDVCSDSIDLGVLGNEAVEVSFSTADAKHFLNVDSCYTRADLARAKVYSFTTGYAGEVGITVTSSTMTDNPRVAVTTDCSDGTCPVWYDQDYSWDDIFTAGWRVEPSTIYFIMVFAHYRNTNGVADFDLRIEQTFVTGEFCSNTIPLSSIEDGQRIHGSTLGKPIVSQSETCKFGSMNSPVDIYEYTAESNLFLSTWIEKSTDFYASINVYAASVETGGCDANITCHGHHDHELVDWEAVRGQTYFIAVYSCCDGKAAGEYLLSFRNLQIGDTCTDATDLGYLGHEHVIVSDSTVGMPIYPFLQTCVNPDEQWRLPVDDYAYSMSPAKIYTFVASQTGRLQVELVAYDLTWSLYGGRCDDLYCLGSDVVEGQSYFLVIRGETSRYARLFTIEIKLRGESTFCDKTIEDLGRLGFEHRAVVGDTGTSVISDLPSCADHGVQSSAAVYSVTTTESGVVSAYASRPYIGGNFRVSVFRGSCEQLECHGIQEHLSTSWISTVNETVYVVVSGCCQSSSSGAFVLHLELSNADESCVTATEIESMPTSGVLEVNGMYSEELVETESFFPTCGDEEDFTRAPVVVARQFSARSSGWLQATISSMDAEDETNFRIFVYEGGCTKLRCGKQYAKGREVTWEAELGSTYIIAAHGLSSTENKNYMLRLEELTTSTCYNPEPLGELHDGIVLSSFKLDEFKDMPSCGSSTHSRYGQMRAKLFTVRGNGNTVAAQFFGGQSSSKLSVFEGNCERLLCARTYGGNRGKPFAIWDTVNGTIYRVFVESFSRSPQSFGLVMSPVQPGDLCEDAEHLGDIPSEGLIVSGSTSGRPLYSGLLDCYTEGLSSPAKVYILETLDTDERFEISVASRDGFTAYVSVYEGCDDQLVCVDKHGYKRVELDATSGMRYFVVVSGTDGPNDHGVFRLVVEKKQKLDICSSIPTLSPGTAQKGSTDEDSYLVNLPNCAEGGVSPGSIYSVEGTGGALEVLLSQEDDQYLHPQVSVIAGDCHNLECVVEPTRADPSVIWNTELGVNYTIYVSVCCGYRMSIDFEISLRELETLGMCENPMTITAGSTSVQTARETYSDLLGTCRSDAYNARYLAGLVKIEGTGASMLMTLSGLSYNIAAISVLSGDCASPSCDLTRWGGPPVAFDTDASSTYYIAFFGHGVGDYAIMVENLVDNYVCIDEHLTGVLDVQNRRNDVPGSTRSERVIGPLPSCYHSGDTLLPRAQTYRIEGDGGTYAFYVSDSNRYTPQLILYDSSCEVLVCHFPADNQYEPLIVKTAVGKNYTLVVNHCCVYEASDDYTLHMERLTVTNLSEVAIDLLVDQDSTERRLRAATIGGAMQGDLPVCSDFIQSPSLVFGVSEYGHWKVVVKGLGFDARVAVYEVDDDSNEYACKGSRSSPQQVSWQNDESDVSFVVVYGCCDESSVGEFDLVLSRMDPPVNLCDTIRDQGALPEGGILLQGETGETPFRDEGLVVTCNYENHRFCASSSAISYSVQGNGAEWTARIVLPRANSVDGSIMVYQGACGAFECINGARAERWTNRELRWFAELDETYTIIVSSCAAGTDFVLRVYET